MYRQKNISSNFSSPFGVTLNARDFTSEDYRYGFNGQERDDEVKGEGNSYDFGSRMHDPRIGRPLSLDPQAHNFPEFSPYSFANNNPIFYIDNEGENPVPALVVQGTHKEFLSMVGMNVYRQARDRGYSVHGAIVVTYLSARESSWGIPAAWELSKKNKNFWGHKAGGQLINYKAKGVSTNSEGAKLGLDFLSPEGTKYATGKFPDVEGVLQQENFTSGELSDALKNGTLGSYCPDCGEYGKTLVNDAYGTMPKYMIQFLSDEISTIEGKITEAEAGLAKAKTDFENTSSDKSFSNLGNIALKAWDCIVATLQVESLKTQKETLQNEKQELETTFSQ